MDDFTGKMEPMNYARVCLEIGVKSLIRDHIMVTVFYEIVGCDKDIEIKVEYQNKPVSCSMCNVFGHSSLKCPKVKPKWVKKSTAPELILNPSADIDTHANLSPSANDNAYGSTHATANILYVAAVVINSVTASSLSLAPVSTISNTLSKAPLDANDPAPPWTIVNRGKGVSHAYALSEGSPSTPVSNSFSMLPGSSEVVPFSPSSTDDTPMPNPLVCRLN